jgi:hypothetical protein
VRVLLFDCYDYKMVCKVLLFDLCVCVCVCMCYCLIGMITKWCVNVLLFDLCYYIMACVCVTV